jgi:CheY-like chemotaxis protein
MTTVMIVEDEVFLQDLYSEVLTREGHEVVATAPDGEAAIGTFRAMAKKPALILMDHRMPVKNGVEAMNEILALDPSVCILFLTADFSIAKAAVLGGAVGYIAKPFTMEALVNAVNRVLDLRKGHALEPT